MKKIFLSLFTITSLITPALFADTEIHKATVETTIQITKHASDDHNIIEDATLSADEIFSFNADAYPEGVYDLKISDNRSRTYLLIVNPKFPAGFVLVRKLKQLGLDINFYGLDSEEVVPYIFCRSPKKAKLNQNLRTYGASACFRYSGCPIYGSLFGFFDRNMNYMAGFEYSYENARYLEAHKKNWSYRTVPSWSADHVFRASLTEEITFNATKSVDLLALMKAADAPAETGGAAGTVALTDNELAALEARRARAAMIAEAADKRLAEQAEADRIRREPIVFKLAEKACASTPYYINGNWVYGPSTLDSSTLTEGVHKWTVARSGKSSQVLFIANKHIIGTALKVDYNGTKVRITMKPQDIKIKATAKGKRIFTANTPAEIFEFEAEYDDIELSFEVPGKPAQVVTYKHSEN